MKNRDNTYINMRSRIWIILFFLCCFGALMIYSTTSYRCSIMEMYHNDSTYLMKHQAQFVCAGLAAILMLQYVDYRILDKIAVIIYIAGIISILLLKTPLAVSAKGASRWLRVAGVQFQVAELVKICVIIALSSYLNAHKKSINKNKLAVHMWLIGGFPAALLFKLSNDLSSSLVVLGITFCLGFIYTGTAKMHITIAFLGAVVIAGYVLYIYYNLPSPEELDLMPFRVGRIAAWLDPERYRQGQGYQILQAKYAIARGGLWGQGLGNSLQKMGAIPEAQNDMIFSVICEEMGLAGGASLIFLYIYLIFLLYNIAICSRDVFGSMLVTGVSLHTGIQAVINVAVNANAFPNTGLALPFISYGGTAVLCMLAEYAMVFSVEYHREKKLRGADRKKKKRRDISIGRM